MYSATRRGRPKNVSPQIISSPPHGFSCPFIPSQYAVHVYGQHQSLALLSLIQHCEHGWFCTKCCHEYSGPLLHREHAWRHNADLPFYIRSDGVKALLLIYFSVFYPLQLPYGTFRIHTLCDNRTCVNSTHWKIVSHNQSKFNRAMIPEEVISYHTKRCRHGECTRCCFLWTGSTFLSNKKPCALFNVGKTQYLPLYFLTDKRYPYRPKNTTPVQSCGNTLCFNPAHILLKIKQRGRQKKEIVEK
jgi:hypothetical protein